jgi:predicted anti-sigma-YlaC factor YlaD
MSDPSCRTSRELLGVYVVGAIEPGERAEVDAHLNQCYECREELAGLAPLTAMLHRVPMEEAERIALGAAEDIPDEPSPDMLDSLLRQVGSRRRARRFRAMFTAAAAILIAFGGAAVVSQSLAPDQQHAKVDVATASRGLVAATVRYGKSNWGTTMTVQVTGFSEWTTCKFWVLTKSGQMKLAGGWLVGPGADRLWYPVQVGVPETSVAGFVITSGHKTLLQIPAA